MNQETITEKISDTDEDGLVTRVGNSGCTVIKTVNGYGPYAYHVTKKNGRQTWKYLGRADKVGLVTRVGNSAEVLEQ